MTTIDIVAMPVSEKLRLMETLWDSLCVQLPTDMKSPEWHEPVLADRMRRIAGGEETTSPWPEAKERIRAQTKGG
jgi:putative addiction module component (TIGR02574 family)